MAAARTVTPPTGRAGFLPPALRLPAAAGTIVFAVAVGTTQLALQITHRDADRQLEQLGQVYLDGLAASIRPGLLAGDAGDVGSRMAHAFAEQRGIAERALFAFGADGRLLARHGDLSVPAEAAAALAGDAWRLDDAAGIAWVGRGVEAAGGAAGRIVAALDVAPLLAARARLAWGIVLLDLALAALAALLTWVALRRIGRPLRLLVEALSDAERRDPAPLPPAALGGADPRSAVVLRAYNRMAEGVEERGRLASELAEREQAAALGRLAATIAHEVRNPLGGLATAVSTLRRFGDDAEVRRESLAFLDRGIGALDRIVTSTLTLYRAEDDRPLTRADLEDLAHLVRPAAERRDVTLSLALDLPPGALAPGSGGVRQVLLNLLLNACEATPPGGAVELRAHREQGALLCEISDAGSGLGKARTSQLTDGAGTAFARKRIGLDVVVRLLGSLNAQASVAERPGGGTTIRLTIPAGAGA
jgi:signal transduction histidine kinase